MTNVKRTLNLKMEEKTRKKLSRAQQRLNEDLEYLNNQQTREEIRERYKDALSKARLILATLYLSGDNEVDSDTLFRHVSGTKHQMYSTLQYLKGRRMIEKRIVKSSYFKGVGKLYVKLTKSGRYVMKRKIEKSDDDFLASFRVKILKEDDI